MCMSKEEITVGIYVNERKNVTEKQTSALTSKLATPSESAFYVNLYRAVIGLSG